MKNEVKKFLIQSETKRCAKRKNISRNRGERKRCFIFCIFVALTLSVWIAQTEMTLITNLFENLIHIWTNRTSYTHMHSQTGTTRTWRACVVALHLHFIISYRVKWFACMRLMFVNNSRNENSLFSLRQFYIFTKNTWFTRSRCRSLFRYFRISQKMEINSAK